ncbi:fumarylacetoacetate hydrolase family protein [Solirubrobacter ginsenosidimutans]|uniref:Fumarylacetoacetate hydrolase family protein n=1 Tax=Solirubrobacter ginsenosidimutans TaxID=490573 RepID=A0A9X3MSY4_9ACTN|nr:fumarylacetoacetate hydrolase family protein [Solirubrobacter ginsenosidimutans]MDA0159083.1 fumarylacetoacetate hydrolase family protein [Solirubrobacter ginsenosidimutans]
MRIANLHDRLVLLTGGGAVDVERASDGRFGPDPQAIYARWDEFRAWEPSYPPEPFEAAQLGAPAPRPRQVFALGLNYALHAREARLELPPAPLTFTKFPSCITGPDAEVVVATDRVDWEVELVAVIGREAYRVEETDAWDHVAGLTVGQDLSARDVQMVGSPPQFSLGKSFPGFGPTGPWLVTPDELADRDDLAIGCAVNGEPVQGDRTSSMLFSVAETIAYLSSICTLLPGDLIFTGTPAGVGNRMDPPRYLKPGDALVSTIEGIGSLTTRFIA